MIKIKNKLIKLPDKIPPEKRRFSLALQMRIELEEFKSKLESKLKKIEEPRTKTSFIRGRKITSKKLSIIKKEENKKMENKIKNKIVKKLNWSTSFSFVLFLFIFVFSFLGNVNSVFAAGPTAAITYSANPTKAGTETITATYSAPISSVPNISIDQPGSTDIPATAMTNKSSASSLTWTSRSPSNTYWNSVAFNGSNLFVAVASNAAIHSANGTSWVAATTVPTGTWNSVIYGNGIFVAVSSTDTDRVMTSSDGITWTVAAGTSVQNSDTWSSITYGNSLFVAVAKDGKAMYSSNGTSWTLAGTVPEATNTWNSITFGNGIFVAVASSGTHRVMTSTDGNLWGTASASSAIAWTSVTYGNNLFVAVANTTSANVMTSSNGQTWAGEATPIGANTWNSISYGNGLFFGTYGTGYVAVSPDGQAWTTFSTGVSYVYLSAAYGGYYFMFGTASGTADLKSAPWGNAYSYVYTVHAANNPTYVDGTATVSLSATTDFTGSSSSAPTGNTFMIETAAPTAAITYSLNRAVKSGNSLVITATFNNPMNDSPVPQISISGNNSVSATNMTKTDTTHYYYTYTVGAGDGTDTVALSTGTDAVGDVITSAPTSGSTFTVDNTAPTAAITYSLNRAVKSGDTQTITATFSEPIADSPVPQISISGNNSVAATNMTKTDTAHYYYTYTVGTGNGTDTIALSTGTDSAGNLITAAPTSGATFTVDNTNPTATITAICSTTGDHCTSAGSSANPQQAYNVSTLAGTDADTGGFGINAVNVSLKDTTLNKFLSGTTFSSDPEVYTASTLGGGTWSFDLSHVTLTVGDQYEVHVQPVDNATNSSIQTLDFIFTNSPPTVSNVTASQNSSSDVVTVTYDVTDNESASTTQSLFYGVGATLSGDITSGASTLTVSDATNFPATGTILIDNEIISYTSKSGNILQGLTRGTGLLSTSTTVAAHTSTTPIYIYAPSATGTGIGLTAIGTGKTITWNAVTDTSYENAVETIKVVANDGSTSWMLGTLASAAFIFDTKTPTATVTFDAGVAGVAGSGTVTIPMPTDISTVQYLITDASDSTKTTGWTTITTNTTIPWTFDSNIGVKSLIYQYRDSFGNTSAPVTTSTPTPVASSSFMVQDTSNLSAVPPYYTMYLGWQSNTDVSGFGSYKLEYATSTDNLTYGNYTTISSTSFSDSTINYYMDTGLTANLFYRFRLSVVGTNGNTSVRSNTYLTARADGVQNYSEGGGGSVASASRVENVVVAQNTDKTVTVNYKITDASITKKVNPSYEGYIFYNLGVTLPANAWDNTNKTLTVSNAVKLPTAGFVQVNNEVLKYTGKTGNILTGVTRGTWPTALEGRTTRQNTTFFTGTPVWILANNTTPVAITNTSIATGQDSSITWNATAELALAGSSYSNLPVRVLVHDNQDALSGPLSTQSDYSENGILNTLDLTAPAISFDQTTGTTDVSVTPATVTLDLANAYALDSTVAYAVSGTAQGSGVDYTLANGTATVTAGQTSTTISIPVVNHLLTKLNPTIILTLSNPTNATLGTNTVYTLTLTGTMADITPPNVALSYSETPATPGTTQTITATYSKPLVSAPTISVAQQGSATVDNAAMTDVSSAYISDYPLGQSNDYVKTTTDDGVNYQGFFATDPTKSLIGINAGNSWAATDYTITNQRFHMDLGSTKVITRIYYENYFGGFPASGVKDFTFWGSNNANAFNDLTYSDNTGWTQLTTGSSQFAEHVAQDVADPHYINVTNSTAYRYYAFKFADNWGNTGNIGIRRIELQEGGLPTYSYNYSVHQQNGTTYKDGTATVSLSSTQDAAGNISTTPTNNTFTISGSDVTPPNVALSYSETPATPGTTETITATYSKPLVSVPTISVAQQGSATVDNAAMTNIAPASVWTERTAPELDTLISVAYGNGLFVAVGTNVIMTSPDGITWTVQTEPNLEYWTSVVYANGIFVAVGQNSTVTTSPDGINWTERTAPNGFWRSVAYGNGMFAAGGDSGAFMTSPDGITWTTKSIYGDWYSIAYGNGLFVAPSADGDGHVLTSPDGITWTSRSTVGTYEWESVTYAAGVFVSVSYEGHVMTSPDGINWTNQTATSTNNWIHITYGNGLFVTVAGNGHIMTSPVATYTYDYPVHQQNGTTYKDGTATVSLSSTQDAAGNISTAPTNSTFEISGSDITSPTVALSYSENPAAAGTTETITAVYSKPITSVPKVSIVQQGIASITNASMTDVGGASVWTARTTPFGHGGSVAYGNGTFVEVGINAIKVSPDGINWTSPPNFPYNYWNSVTYINGLFVVPSSGIVATSPDGMTWTTHTAPAGQWYNVAYGNGTFVAIGPGGSAMTSPDAITWTAQTIPEANIWQSIAYGNGTFVAGANNGTHRIMTSPDGITWTSQTTPETDTNDEWVNMSYNNGTFLALTLFGYVETSTDGINWTTKAKLPYVSYWTSLTYGGGIFVAVGNNAVETSTDGTNWTVRTAPSSAYWTSLAYGSGTFVAVADMSVAMSSPISAYSYGYQVHLADGVNYKDGLATASLSSTEDAAGNISTAPTNATFNILSTQVQFTEPGSSGLENVSTVEIPVSIAQASPTDTTVDYAVDPSSTAVSGTDYTIANGNTGTVTIPAGQTTANIEVTIIDGKIKLVDKNIVLTLSNPTNSTLGTNTTYTYTIQNSNTPTIAFDTATGTGTPNTTPVLVPISLSIASGMDTTIDYTVSGTAQGSGVNYTLDNGTVTIPAGQTTANISIDIANHLLSVPSMNIVLTLSNPTNATIGTNAVYTYTITANNITVQFSDASSAGSQNVSLVNIPVALTSAYPSDVTVDYAVDPSSTAVSGTDYTIDNLTNGVGTLTIPSGQTLVHIPVNIIDTKVFAPDKTLVLTLSNPTEVSLGTNATYTYTINNDNAPVIQFTNANASGMTSVTPINAVVSLSVASTMDTTVSYTVSGTAVNGTDYSLVDDQSNSISTGTITIPAGQTSATITIPIINHILSQPSETIILTLSSPVNGTLGSNVAYTYTLTSINGSNIKATSAIMSWTTGDPSDSKVEYGTIDPGTDPTGPAAGSYNLSKYDVNNVLNHNVYLGNLTPSTTYFVKTTSTDANSVATVSYSQFTTTAGPSISGVASSGITDTGATITWTTDIPATSYVNYSTDSTLANPIRFGTNDLVTAHSVTLVNLNAQTNYYFSVDGADANSNVGEDANDNDGTPDNQSINPTYYTFETARDVTPPVISNIQTPVITDTQVAITWQTNEVSDSQVQYGLTPGTYDQSTDLISLLVKNHLATISNLTKSTEYYYVVVSADANGNATTSPEKNFTTTAGDGVTVISGGGGGSMGVAQDVYDALLAENQALEANSQNLDTTPPVISNIKISDVTSFTATVSFDTDQNTEGFIRYGKDKGYGLIATDQNPAKSHSIKLNGLSFGTDYYLVIDAKNDGGKITTSDQQTFKTKFFSENLLDAQKLDNIEQFQNEVESTIESILPSLAPPFLETPIISDITENSATVSFSTNIKSYPVIGYTTDANYDATKDNPYDGEISDTTQKTIAHKLTLNDLKPNTKYHVMAKAFSLPEVVGRSDDLTFTTLPSKVQGSIINVKTDSFTVVWTTDEPTSSVVDYRDLKTGITARVSDDTKNTSHSVKIENLPSGTTYEVNISGINNEGNNVQGGTPMDVTTSTDITPPVITNVKVDSTLIVEQTDRVQTIISWQTDKPSTSTVYYQEGSGPVDKQLNNKQETLELTKNHAVILTVFKPGTIYRFTVSSTDGSDNMAILPIRTIITPQKSESIMDIIFKNFDQTFNFMNNVK